MTDLERFTGNRPSALARRGARAISRNKVGAQTRISEIDAEVDAAIAKVSGSSMATGAAMSAVVQVCQAREALERIAPAAAGDLAYLAQEHALGLAEFLGDLRRELRRR